ncbi:hypothetical protein ACG74X_09990 [Marivita sp. S0852]|uniref:hypothetical protein n=1 Tax=Marivita sp. S0852 TaxID=3373893 RepID=UPI003982CF22
MTLKTVFSASTFALAVSVGMGVAQDADGTWRADLTALNPDATQMAASGTATLTVSGDTLTITVDATGTAPGIMHLQHFHGFAEGDATSACPGADADANGDGIVDLIETEPVAGVTMVPFHDDPANLEIVTETYPTADEDGRYSYEQTVSLSDLEARFADAFPGQQLDFDRRVVFLHGVSEDMDLPETAQSLGDIPAHVTLPIACGTLDRADG